MNVFGRGKKKAIIYPKCRGKRYFIFKIVRGQKNGSKKA